jgi:hypothetical protein
MEWERGHTIVDRTAGGDLATADRKEEESMEHNRAMRLMGQGYV